MATVNQTPAALSLAGNLKPFKISSTESVQFRLLKGGVELLSQRYEPGADGVLEIDVKAIVFASLAYAINSGNSYVQSAIAADFIGEVDGASFAFRAVRGGVANLADTDSNWLRNHFLTWQPKIKPVTYYSPEWLTYYGVQEATIKLLATFDGGATQTLTLASVAAGTAVTVNVQYASIAGRLGNVYPTHYKVWAESTAGARLTDEQFYTYSEPLSDDEQWYLFENSLGGLDTFRAYGVNNFDGTHTHNIAEFGETYKEYDVEAERVYNKNTGYLNDYARVWMLDFFPSRDKYIYEDNAIRKIVVTDSDVKYVSSDLPSAYSFSYKFADKTRYLNLIRNESELPANLVVPNLDAPDFIFPPRLSELPRILLTEGVLIPAFDPNSPTATVTTFGEIKQVIVEAALDAIPSTGGPGTGTLVVIMKSTDETSEPSDSTVFTSKKAMIEIAKAVANATGAISGNYLRKDAPDTATELITFQKGIKIGEALFTWDAESGSLKISESLYSLKEISAYGAGSGAGTGGTVGSLGGLTNVGLWADEVPASDRIMVQLAGATHWSSMLLSEIVGLDTNALANYLTTNNYVTKNYVTEEISKLNIHTHDNKTLLDLITQGNIDVLSHLSIVDGRLKADVDFYSTGEVSAYGAGSSSGGGGGLISSVLGSTGLGGSYLDSDLTNTFNAYTINLINTNLTGALGRIGALETSTPNVAWGTPTSQYSPLTINSVTRNLSLDGHTHSYLPLSGGNLTGGLTINSNTVWHDGNDGVGSGLDADFLRGVAPSNLAVLSATKLANTRTIWGQPFNGEGDVSGPINNATTGNFSGAVSVNSFLLPANANIQFGTTWNTGVLSFLNGVTETIVIDVPGGKIKNNLGKYLISSSSVGQFGTQDNYGLALVTNNTEKLRIDTNGNVGIGTASPSYKLDVNGSFRSLGAAYLNSTLSVTGASTLTGLLTANGGITANDLSTLRGISVTNGSYSKGVSVGSNSHLQMDGVVASYTYTLPATIGWYRVAVSPSGVERPFGQFDISWTLSSYHGAVSLTAGTMFSSAPYVSQSAYTNFGTCITKSRIVYHPSYHGNYAYLEIYNETGKAVALTVRGYNLTGWTLYSASTAGSIPSGYSNKEISHTEGYMTSGNVAALGEITAYSASDIRLKTEVVSLTNSLQIIQALNPVSYKWNSIAKELNPLKGNNTDYGLIAQDMETVMPELVHTIYGDYKSVDYVKLIPHLICAIQQLKMEIDHLKKIYC